VASLVAKSLLLREEDPEGEPRVGMLETIREYGLEQLEASGEADATRQAHAAFFLALADEAESKLRGPEQRTWLMRLESEHDNLRTALSWTLADADRAEMGLRLAGALGWFWFMHAHFVEGSRWLAHALAAGTPAATSVRAHVLLAAGRLAHFRGDQGHAERLLEEALTLFRLFRAVGGDRGAGPTLSTLGLVALSQGDPDRAGRLLLESTVVRRAVGDRWGAGNSLINLGRVKLNLGDLDGATRVLEEGIALCREMGDMWSAAVGLGRLGTVAQARGDLDQGLTPSREALQLGRELGDRRTATLPLQTIGIGASADRDYVRAARLFGAVETLRAEIGVPHDPEDRAIYEREVAAVRAAMSQDEFEVASREGRGMSLEQAVAYALGEPMLN
jgi:hypothetical protein